MAVIEVKHIRKTFGTKDALADVSFAIPKGEIFIKLTGSELR